MDTLAQCLAGIQRDLAAFRMEFYSLDKDVRKSKLAIEPVDEADYADSEGSQGEQPQRGREAETDAARDRSRSRG